jgi:hypothetical protein
MVAEAEIHAETRNHQQELGVAEDEVGHFCMF